MGIVNSLSNMNSKDNPVNQNFDLLIIDECHILGANQFLKILDIYNRIPFILALSGTPDRQDNKHKLYYNYFDYYITLKIYDDVDV